MASDELAALPEAERRCVLLFLALNSLNDLQVSMSAAAGGSDESKTPEASKPRSDTLAAFVRAAAEATLRAEGLRAEIGRLREQRQCGGASRNRKAEQIHVFAASAFASLSESLDCLLGTFCPEDPRGRGETPAGSSVIGGVYGHAFPALEALIGCLTHLLLLLRDELLPGCGLVKSLRQPQDQQQSPLSRGWFFASIFGFCMQTGCRALNCCLSLWQPSSASLAGLLLGTLQFVFAAAAAAWPLQFEAHRLRSVGAPNTETTDRAERDSPHFPFRATFQRCFAAPVPKSGGLPSGAVCGIVGHELLLLLQLLSSSSSSSSSTGESVEGSGGAELMLWALRCLYGIACCFNFCAEEGGTNGQFSVEDAAASRDAALRLYPLIAASLFAMFLGTSSSSSSSSRATAVRPVVRPIPRKVACAAAVALREWMRAALGPLPASAVPPVTAAAAAAATASKRLAELRAVVLGAGGEQRGALRGGAAPKGEETEPEEESSERNDEVTTQNAVDMLLSPAAPSTRRKAVRETAKRLQVSKRSSSSSTNSGNGSSGSRCSSSRRVERMSDLLGIAVKRVWLQALWRQPLALSGCWARRFCRLLLAVEWLATCRSSRSSKQAPAVAAATADTSRAAVSVLIESLVDDDARVACLSGAWLSLSSAAAGVEAAAAARVVSDSCNALVGAAWVRDATAFLNSLMWGRTVTADPSLISNRSAPDAAAAAAEYRLLPGGSAAVGGRPVTPLEALELAGDDTLSATLQEAAAAAAACSCCVAPTGARREEAQREKLLAALRRVRGHAKLCLLIQQQTAWASTTSSICSSSNSNSSSSSGSEERFEDIRGLLLVSVTLDVDAAASALRRLCRLRPTRTSSSSSSNRVVESVAWQPAAILFTPQRGANESALEAEPLVMQLDPPPQRACRAEQGPATTAAADRSPEKATRTAAETAAETAAAAAERAAAAETLAAAAVDKWGPDCSLSRAATEGIELAAAGCSASVASSILRTVRETVNCMPGVLRAELLLKLLQLRRDVGAAGESGCASRAPLLQLLRQMEGLVVAAECLSTSLHDYKSNTDTAAQPLLEAWQVDQLLLALTDMQQQLQQQRDSRQQQREPAVALQKHWRAGSTEDTADKLQQQQREQQQQESSVTEACSCFFCSSDETGDVVELSVSGNPGKTAEGLSVSQQTLLWECVSHCMAILGCAWGPKAVDPHLPGVLVRLFEALGSPHSVLAAAAFRALQMLHDVSGRCPALQQHKGFQREQQPAPPGTLQPETPGEACAKALCSDCLATQRAEAAAAAAAGDGGLGETDERQQDLQSSGTERCCLDGPRCLLKTEGSLLLDELACRLQKLPAAAEDAVNNGDAPGVVCLLSAVVALAPASLMGALGSLLTTLLQQHQQLVLHQQQQALMTSFRGLSVPPPVPVWLLRILAVHAFFLSSRVVASRRASYESRWGPFRCPSCASQDPPPSSLPRRSVSRRGLWARPRDSPALPGDLQSLATLRQAALLGCNEDGEVLDAMEAEAAEAEAAAAAAKPQTGRFGALRMQATQVLFCVRHHLRDSRPLAAAYAHLAALRCLLVLSTRERELLPRIHEIWPSIVPSLQQEAPLRVFILGLGILKLLAGTAGHFIRDRFAKEVAAALPMRLCRLQLSALSDSEGRSEPYKSEVAILSTLAFCGTVKPELLAPESALEAALLCCLRCMHGGAPSAVTERATQALVALHFVNPARIWLKCSRAMKLARYLQENKQLGGTCSVRSLPQRATDLLSILAHGGPSRVNETAHQRRGAAEWPEGAQVWLDACGALDILAVEKLRPLMQRRLEAATIVRKEALSKCLQDFTAACLLSWNKDGEGKTRRDLTTSAPRSP